jgi:hypothetical protein
LPAIISSNLSYFEIARKLPLSTMFHPLPVQNAAGVLTSATVLQRLSHLPKFNTQAWLDNLVMQGIAKLSC